MKRNEKKVPGFDEIVFENRNKEYGAFDLREKYSRNSIWSLLLGVAAFTTVVTGLSILSERDVTGKEDTGIIIIVRMDSTLNEVNKLRKVAPVMPKQDIRVSAYIPPVIVDKIDSGDITLVTVSSLDTVKNLPVDPIIIPEEYPDLIPEKTEDPPIIIEEMPTFPGGETALLKFIHDNINYPAEASENNIEGRVVLKFVVGNDGEISRILVLKTVHPVLDQEAVRVISLMPKWKPGRQNGEPAAVWYTIPVNFQLKRK
jgi:periplasmic protein TonB